MKNRDIYRRRCQCNIQETLYTGQWCLSHLQSRHLVVVLPITISCSVVFSWISSTAWHLFLFKGYFSFGKSQASQGTKSGLSGGWVTGRFDVSPNITHVCWCTSGCIVMMKLPIISGCCCGLLNHPNSFRRGTFKLNAEFHTDSLLYSLSHFECEDHTVHMLTQRHLPPILTSTIKSSLFRHVHSSPLLVTSILQKPFLLY